MYRQSCTVLAISISELMALCAMTSLYQVCCIIFLYCFSLNDVANTNYLSCTKSKGKVVSLVANQYMCVRACTCTYMCVTLCVFVCVCVCCIDTTFKEILNTT